MLDPRIVRQQIENLKLIHPELLEYDEDWIATLESETSFEELLTSVVRRIEDTKALMIGTADRFEELKSRKDRFEHRLDVLRNLALTIMQAAELAKVELPEATLSLRAGQPQLIIEDPFFVPEDFCVISRTLDRNAVKNALKAGRTVPGFELSNSPPSLTIRIK